MSYHIRLDDINGVEVADTVGGYAVASFYYQAGMDRIPRYPAARNAQWFIEAEEVRAQRDELLAVLEAVEWIEDDEGWRDSLCPWCGNGESQGHDISCSRQSVITKVMSGLDRVGNDLSS